MRYFGRTILETKVGELRLLEKEHVESERIAIHRHERPYLSVVASGAYEERQCGRRIRLEQGEAFFHVAGEAHADEFLSRSRLLVVEIPEGSLDPSFIESRSVYRSPAVIRFVTTARREMQRPDEMSNMILQGLTWELSGLIGRSQQTKSERGSGAKAADIIARRFCEPIGLQQIADEIGIDPSRLAREFRRETGATIGESIRSSRVEYVCDRLRSSDPLSEIAADAGFADQSHMTRTFRKAMGLTPGAWRRLQRR